MRLDLHLHTSCSDGHLAPADVVREAARASLDLIAVTDHDTVAGIAPAVRAAASAERKIAVLAGIEISCSLDGADLHLLGYGVDPGAPALARLTNEVAGRRRMRAREICGKLAALGVAITFDDLEIPEGNAAIGRPHIARALVRLGRVGGVQEAFDRWLRDGGTAWVPAGGPDVRDAIGVVREAGGVAVWAHPDPGDAARFASLAGAGLEGIETMRPGLAPSVGAVLEHAARRAGLFVTGGSDWHGGARPGGSALGSWYVTERHVGAFLARIGVAA